MKATIRLVVLGVLGIVPEIRAATPNISGVSPTSGPVGTSIAIAGSGFGSSQGASSVTISGTVASTIASWSDTSIIATVPNGAATGNVVVTVDGAPSNGSSFTVLQTPPLPQVAQVQPANASSGAPLNQRIVVRFAQPVQPNSIVPSTLTLSQGSTGIAGTLALSNDGLSLTFTPTQLLAASSGYTVSVTDVAGDQTTPEFQSTFTTGTSSDSVAPQILQCSPPNNAADVPINAPIMFQFTKAIDPATFTPSVVQITDGTSHQTISGTTQVDASGLTGAFIPLVPLGVGRFFYGSLSFGIRDTSGNFLSGSASIAFTTAFFGDSQGPTLLGISPADQAGEIPTNALVVAGFDKPLNPISVADGFRVQQNGVDVPGGVALSSGNELITFTPQGGLSPNTSYEIILTPELLDEGGLPLQNPGTFSYSTGSSTDTASPQVSSVSPPSASLGVATNVVVSVRFSKPVDPLTITGATFYLQKNTVPVVGTVTPAVDGMSATFTPAEPLNPWAQYTIIINNGVADIEGHALSYSQYGFTTGAGTVTQAPTVNIISPPDGASGIPVNTRIVAVLSSPINAQTVGSGAITLTSGGVSASGTTAVSSDDATITFTPNTALATGTSYSITVSGFADWAGNTVAPFTSSFTTSSSNAVSSTGPSVTGVSPANGATSVPTSSSVVLTFNEAVDPTTVYNSTVSIVDSSFRGTVAGNYSFDSTGTVLTFTPQSPLPANATFYVEVSNVRDYAGNVGSSFFAMFFTGTGSDTTAPTVLKVAPQNGMTNVAPTSPITLVFSKSLNPNTVTAQTIGLFANGSLLTSAGPSVSSDNRTVTITSFSTPPNSTISIVASSAVTDMSGNPLIPFQSQFITGPAVDSSRPIVVSQHPATGATGVSTDTSVVLYLNEPMNSSTLQGALHISQNGVLVTGTTQVTNNSQVVQFTPSSSWQKGALIQVWLDSSALDLAGNPLYSYQGSFSTSVDTTNIAPQLIGSSPADGSNPVPTNMKLDLQFNEPVDANKLTDTSVQCFQNGIWTQIGLLVEGDGSRLQVVPRFPFAPNASIRCLLDRSITGINGLQFLGYIADFTTGAGPDTTAPQIVSVSPPNGWTNVGDNAYIRLIFSEPIDPLTVNANTVQLTGDGVTLLPDSMAFTNNNQSVKIVPHAALPDSTLMTLTINGVADLAGNPVTPQTYHFTTGVGPDLTPPTVISSSPFDGAVGVPTNAVVNVQLSEPIDPSTVTVSGISVDYDGQDLPGTPSISADGETISFLPSAPLPPNASISTGWGGATLTDLAGNICCSGPGHVNFQTGNGPSATSPQVVQISPSNGATALATNVQLMIELNEPINATRLSGVVLSAGSGAVAFRSNLSNGNQTLNLVPVAPLSPNTSYTLSISGLQDLSGNIQTVPFTSSFITGAGGDVTPAAAVSVIPGNGASGVDINSVIQVQFNKPLNPLTITTSTFQIYPANTALPINGSITISLDGRTVTFTPASPLASRTTYVINPTSAITDLQGIPIQAIGYYQGVFTTAEMSSGLPPYIASPSDGTSGNVGYQVLVRGSYFGPTQGTSTITFNGIVATAWSWSDTLIVTSVPSGAVSGPLVVTVNGQQSNPVTYKVLYTPVLDSFSPTTAVAGATLTLNGSNFGSPADDVSVSFSSSVWTGSKAIPVTRTETSLTVVVPTTAVSGNIQVLVDGQPSNASYLTIIPTPSVVSLDPPSGVGGGLVYISGRNFGNSQGDGAVYFNGALAENIRSWSDDFIQVFTPANVTTGAVTVVRNSVTSNSDVVFTVVGPAIGSIKPPGAAPGAKVTITGSGLSVHDTPTQIFFNGVAGTIPVNGNGYQIVSPTSFTAIVPQNATSGPVTVQIGNATSNTLEFTVEQPPTITGISPNNGQAGQWPITISGSGFGDHKSNSSVMFWGDVPADVISWSENEIQVIVPDDATTGPISVQVGGILTSGPWFYASTPTTLTDSLGNNTNYFFGVNGGSWGLASSQGPGCSTCTVRGTILETTDANGNILTHTDDLGHVTSYGYDSNNNVTSVSQQLDANTPVATSYTYNSFGEVLTMTDALGNVTTNQYDTKGNLLSVTTPAPDGNTPASVTRFTYDTKGQLTQITDPLSNATTLTYTPAGLIASITDAQNHTTSYQYDARGNRTAVIDPINGAAHPTTFTYDIMNRLTGITYPDGSSVGFGYDYRGRRTSVTDQNQKTTYYNYDDADRLTSVTDPANNTTYYGYDTEDNLTSITDANNHTTNFEYNARGWVTQTTFPSTLVETYGYDAVGNLTSKTDRKNQTIQYVYDALNRLSHKGYPDSTGVDYIYDLVGKIRQVSDPTGVYGFAYDNMGRLIGTTTQYSFLPGQTFTNAYTYDAASNRKSLTAPDGSITTYGYDSLNRLNGLANSWAGSFGFGYDALSRRTSLTRPNGVNTSYSYDSVSHLLSVLHQAGTNILDGASYTYDPAGNRTSKTNYLNGVTENYTYDPLYELTQVTQGGSTTETYSYDAVGNRLSSLGVSSYQYNASNELTSSSLGSYTYDANGSTLSDPAGKTYTWDFDNRMSSVFVPDTGTVTFKYDAFGRRIQKSSPLGTTNYVYDGENLLEEGDSSGSVLARYAQGVALDEPLSQFRSGALSYYNADGLNSVTTLTNASGTTAQTYAYDAFGNLSASTGTITNSFRYTSRDFDAETGLNFHRARYYDSQIGRFLSEDPIGFDGGMNFYAYVGNDPTDDLDSYGLKRRKRRPKSPKCDAVFPHDPTTAHLAQLVFAEGNGSMEGDLAIASVVINRANYGNPLEFGNGINGVINKKGGFQAVGNALFNSVSSQAKVCRLNPANCQRYKNAVLAAIAAEAPDGTNTDALFYYDTSISLPPFISNGLQNGSVVPAHVPGGIGNSGNYLQVPPGGYGNDQVFFNYSNFSH